jgi:RimJ/RimL family protein N-acetyltransferase
VSALLKALLLEIPDRIATERLTLRAPAPGRGPEIHAAVSESIEALGPWMPWARAERSPEESERHCREMLARWHAREELDFCFYRSDDGMLVGKGGLHTIDWAVPKFEIGYWIRTSCSRRGYATEATRALVAFARDRLGACRLEITSDTRNAASRRVAEKAGFELEGIRRSSRRGAGGELADSCMYARVF